MANSSIKKGRQPTNIEVGHKELREALMLQEGVKEHSVTAFNSRLKRIIASLDPDDRRANQRSPNRRYYLANVLEISLCLHIQRAYVSPLDSAEFVRRERPALYEIWRRALVKYDDYMLELPLDAFREPHGWAFRELRLATEFDAHQGSVANQATLPVLRINVSGVAHRALEKLAEATCRFDREGAVRHFVSTTA